MPTKSILKLIKIFKRIGFAIFNKRLVSAISTVVYKCGIGKINKINTTIRFLHRSQTLYPNS